ncbi:MAG: AbrB/MazE/SpoVT family DNA-binding domain-containing protein [Thermomicrobiales bacterium]|nr:AbrB/MazE/SpoVT family DNA-binding domain-containing protein [Thermomicrobiales bacterium]
MAHISVKISSKHQIAVPSAIRKELQLEAGDRLSARVRDGVIVLVPQRGDAVDQLRCLHPEIWTSDIQSYLDEERDAWDSPQPS